MTSWPHVEAALNGILDRRWYTNHGPLARMLEAEWGEASGRKHAIAVVNPTIALIMMAEALRLHGEVLLSALAPARCIQALAWAGLRPKLCDIEAATFGIDRAAVVLSRETCALLATPGTAAGTAMLFVATHGLALFSDGLPGLPCPTLIDLPGLGDDAGSACILTDDGRISGRLRNIRSSYGAGAPAFVVRTANGRLSEAQAATALLEPAGSSFQSLAFPPCLAVIGERRYLPYGRELIVACDSATERDALTRECEAAGLRSRPLVLHPLAGSCTTASAVATCALVITPGQSGGAPG